MTFNLTNLAGTASHLTFVQQPTDAVTGQAITPAVTVQLINSSGNPAAVAGVSITLQLSAPAPIGTTPFAGAVATTNSNGLATFAGLVFSLAGTYRLTAETTGYASAESNSFNITAGPPSAIQATGGTPQSAIILTVFGEALQVTITDAGANPIGGVPVVFTAPTSGATGLFGGQSSVTVNTDVHGHATAIITANSVAGSYQVTASSNAVSGLALFNLTNLPVGSSSLVFVQQPSNTAAGTNIAPPVTVQLRDSLGNGIGTAGIPIVMSLSSGTGTLIGTIVQLTDTTGTATFSDLKIGQTGVKTLRASSSQQAPADSSQFTITAGGAASITVFTGSPQSTLISQPFPTALQAQVTDAAGNPASGVLVTFTLPASSGPSGVFSGAATAISGSNGVATAPGLTANNQVGSFVVTATAPGVSSPALFALTNLPSTPSTIVVNPAILTFTSQINQSAPLGQTVQIGGAAVTWTAASSATWLNAAPASGSTPGQIAVTVNPAGLTVGVYTGSIAIKDSTGGVSLVSVTYTITSATALVVTPPALVFITNSPLMTPAMQTLQTTSTSNTIVYNVSFKVSTPSGGNWLQISSTKGQTAGSLTVSVNPAGLAQGVYDGSVLFTPVDPTINQVAVPVTLIVGCGQGGCLLQPNIIAVVNGASFHPGGAPGAIMTIFGTNLSDAIYQSTVYPLATQLGPTSVIANGVPVPLFYASPTQINFQMPSGVSRSAAVQITVANQTLSNARGLLDSPSHSSVLPALDPGLFVTADNRAAALNGDLVCGITAATPIPATATSFLFRTGCRSNYAARA